MKQNHNSHTVHPFCINTHYSAVPLDLLYLPEHQALPAIFEFLKEEASVAGKF